MVVWLFVTFAALAWSLGLTLVWLMLQWYREDLAAKQLRDREHAAAVEVRRVEEWAHRHRKSSVGQLTSRRKGEEYLERARQNPVLADLADTELRLLADQELARLRLGIPELGTTVPR